MAVHVSRHRVEGCAHQQAHLGVGLARAQGDVALRDLRGHVVAEGDLAAGGQGDDGRIGQQPPAQAQLQVGETGAGLVRMLAHDGAVEGLEVPRLRRIGELQALVRQGGHQGQAIQQAVLQVGGIAPVAQLLLGVFPPVAALTVEVQVGPGAEGEAGQLGVEPALGLGPGAGVQLGRHRRQQGGRSAGSTAGGGEGSWGRSRLFIGVSLMLVNGSDVWSPRIVHLGEVTTPPPAPRRPPPPAHAGPSRKRRGPAPLSAPPPHGARRGSP